LSRCLQAEKRDLLPTNLGGSGGGVTGGPGSGGTAPSAAAVTNIKHKVVNTGKQVGAGRSAGCMCQLPHGLLPLLLCKIRPTSSWAAHGMQITQLCSLLRDGAAAAAAKQKRASQLSAHNTAHIPFH
jgi:hypothetical protein